MMLAQCHSLKLNPELSHLVGSDAENALPTRNEAQNSWLNVAGLSWIFLEEDYP